jgi:ribosomal protein S18 acetylase RimI-like enzyme
MDVMDVTLRRVGPEDGEFILAVYASTRDMEMAMVPWSPEQKQAFLTMQCNAQLSHYQIHHPNAVHQVVLHSGRPVGRLYIDRRDDVIHILDLTVLTECRSAGVGSAILRELMSEGAAADKPVRIHVESFCPSLRLFDRLGFARIAENGAHYLLEWRPGKTQEKGR